MYCWRSLPSTNVLQEERTFKFYEIGVLGLFYHVLVLYLMIYLGKADKSCLVTQERPNMCYIFK